MKRPLHHTVDASKQTALGASASADKKRRLEIFGTLALLLASLIWGSSFVAQSIGMDYIAPLTFTTIRSFVGALALGVVIAVLALWKRIRGIEEKKAPGSTKTLWVGGILCGIALAIASNLQQFGIAMTTVGKSGFLTALYIIEVPLFGLLFGKRVRPIVWGCVGIALAGMYLLCIGDGFTLATGDLLVFLCSFLYSAHIMIIDVYAPKVDCIKLSAIQFLVAGVISFVLMLIFEEPDMSSIMQAAIPLLYTGVLSSGVAFTLQIVGQKWVSPTVTTLLMSLESVFSLLSGAIILGEIPSLREGSGACLVFFAIILAQVNVKPVSKKEK